MANGYEIEQKSSKIAFISVKTDEECVLTSGKQAINLLADTALINLPLCDPFL